MKIATFVGILILATSLHANAQVDELYGTWRLLSWAREVVDTGERGISVRESRPKPTDLAKMTDQERADLFKTMVAYGGTFRVEGNRFITNVDISWNENWTGTLQPRNFKIDGKRLIISVDPQVGVDGRRVTAVLTWEKVQ